MKNIHILPTDKPSRLVIDTIENKLYYQAILHKKTVNVLTQDIYITSNEKIKEGDWFMSNFNSFPLHNIKELSEREGTLGWKQEDLKNNLKIILTTDQELIKDGVQAIDDKFLKWFVKNPSCEEVKIESWQTKGEWDLDYKIIIPNEEPKQETLEEAMNQNGYHESNYDKIWREGVEFGAKWGQERMYSEEELKSAFKIGFNIGYGSPASELDLKNEYCEKWFEQFKNKWQAEKMYSEKEVLAMLLTKHDGLSAEYVFEQFKKK